MADEIATIHIAGNVVLVGSRQRQRCSWCGALIDDHDLALIAFPLSTPEAERNLPHWEGLVLIDGNMKASIPHEDGDVLPDGCCAKLDPEVTR